MVAFFRMKLHPKDIASKDPTAKLATIICYCQSVLGMLTIKKERMQEIELGIGLELMKERMSRPWTDVIPPHMGQNDFGLAVPWSKFFDSSWNPPQPRTNTFFTRIRKDLHPDTDSKDWNPLRQNLLLKERPHP